MVRARSSARSFAARDELDDCLHVAKAGRPFGKWDEETVESLVVRVTREALDSRRNRASRRRRDRARPNLRGFSPQDFTAAASLVFQASDPFRFAGDVVENACATGSAAVQQAIKTIEAACTHGVAVGVERDLRPGDRACNFKASYLPERRRHAGGFAGVFGKIASYFQRYGDQSDALARIAGNHRNGVDNPCAQMRKDLGFDFCRNVSDKNPLVAGPLKRTDCSLVSDGAAAMVSPTSNRALHRSRPVVRRSPRSRISCPCAPRHRALRRLSRAWGRALSQAGVTLADLTFVETHDCFTIAELIEYEAMGLTPEGRVPAPSRKAGPRRTASPRSISRAG